MYTAICESSTRNISMINLRNEKMKRNMDFLAQPTNQNFQFYHLQISAKYGIVTNQTFEDFHENLNPR